MPTKIDKKIAGWAIKQSYETQAEKMAGETAKITMSESVKRPYELRGSTYKIKPPNTPHALYLTINDIALNHGTDDEEIHPYEVFVNSKNMDSFQWIVGITRLISAIFRKGGNVEFMIEELKSVFDPRGGYWDKKTYMPSVVAHIGHVIEHHMKKNGALDDSETAEMQEMAKAILAEKEFEMRDKATSIEFPDHAAMCAKCSQKAVVVMDGCQTCLSCGDSKCG